MRKDCIARELTREIVVGAFMVMIFLGLGYFTIILSRENVFSPKTEMEVVFDDVMGLRETDAVVVRGMPIGKVDGLALEEDGVHVRLSLDKKLHMKPDYLVTVVATSVLGGRHLLIEEGSADEADLPMGTLFIGTEPYDLIGDTSELVNSIKKQFMEGGLIDNLRSASEQLKQITERLAAGEGSLGRLLSSDDTLYTDLSEAVGSLKAVAGGLEAGEGTLGKLLSSDDDVYEDLKASSASLREITGRLERGEGTLGKLLSEDEVLYQDLKASVSSLKNVAGKLEHGEGAIGRLMVDDSLYNELEAAVTELRATLDDFRETSPVTTFTSIFFGSF